jgi:signal transduction histidine kinase
MAMEEFVKRVALPMMVLAAALALRWLMDPYLGNTNPYITLYGAVAVVVWLGGFLPAALVAATGLFIANYLFLEPFGMIGFPAVDDVVAAGLYAGSCGLIAALGGALWSAKRSANYAAQRLLELDRKRTRFLPILSNELRNALQPIRVAVETMSYADDPASLKACAATLQRHMHRCGRMVDDLIDLNKATQAKLEIERYPVDLVDVVNSAVNSVRPVLDDAAVMLDVVIRDPVQVEGDPLRLAQIFENLLENAAQFTGRGGIVTVVVARHSNQALVVVRDNGMGIDRGELPHVFEVFSQRQPAKRGLGIGLALVKTLVELHDGNVAAKSDGIGKGSEFVVSLPALEAKPQMMQERLAA